MNEKEVVPDARTIKNIFFNLPKNKDSTHKMINQELNNSWNKGGYLDNYGHIWVEAEKLYSILKTSKNNFQFYITQISKENKIYTTNGMYIKGYEVNKIIDKEIQKEKLGTRQSYLLYSELLYEAIRDCDKAQNLRKAYNFMLKKNKKGLKKKRMKKYKIIYDELTGQPLKRLTCEFAHIRSFAIFKDIDDDIENGLIINKEVYYEILRSGVNDENELLALCEEKGWDIEWYEKFWWHFGK